MFIIANFVEHVTLVLFYIYIYIYIFFPVNSNTVYFYENLIQTLVCRNSKTLASYGKSVNDGGPS